jgi:signal peptidase I
MKDEMKINLSKASRRDVFVRDARILILILALGIIFHLSFLWLSIDGESMFDTYSDGEEVLVNRVSHKIIKLSRGDVIAFSNDGGKEILVKRIIGMPNEKIKTFDGQIFIDDVLYEDEFSERNDEYSFGYVNYTLKQDEYWVVGDNRSNTWSGKIKKENIIGVILN